MTISREFWLDLRTSFEKDFSINQQLLELLNREREALENRDYGTFQKIISDKLPLLKLLEQHSSSRQKQFKESGFNSEEEALMAAEQQAPEIAKLWRQLGEQWQQCQQLNQVNEKVAQRTKLVVGKLLDILRGENSQNKIYTPKGDTIGSATGRTITSA
jgi:flagella synthesis protein FlgN